MRVVIIDDDRLVCVSLKTILETEAGIEVVSVGNSGEEAIRLYEEKRPAVLLMDIRMGKMTGLEAGEAILKKFPDARILYLTTFLDDEYIVKAIKMGAKGYILKQNFESIVPAIRAVHMGQSVFGDEIVLKIPKFLEGGRLKNFDRYGINEKEMDLIKLVAEGCSNKEIAGELYLSEGTVRNYLSIILEKLHLRDRTQLAVFYYKNS